MYMIDETALTPQVWLLDDQQGRDGIHMTMITQLQASNGIENGDRW